MAFTRLGVGGSGKSYGTIAGKVAFIPALPPRLVEYIPGPVPYNVNDHTRYLQTELFRISNVLSILIKGYCQEVHQEPTAPRTGDICLADGTDWNPGGGQGLYCYYNRMWNKL